MKRTDEDDRRDQPDTLHRLDAKGQTRPFDFRSVHVDLGQNADTVYQHVLALVQLIIKEDAAAWPGEDEWKRRLPDWALERIRSLSREEADELLAATPREQWGRLPWDFGSWLDALKVRGWIWWNHRRSGKNLEIVLGIIEVPSHLEAFEELIRLACGAVNSSE